MLWNKKSTYCGSLPKWSEIKLYSPPMVLSKIFDRFIQGKTTWNSREKLRSAIPREQNWSKHHGAWLVKNSKTVFSKLTQKIFLSVSGKQASRQFTRFLILSCFLECYFSVISCTYRFRQMFDGFWRRHFDVDWSLALQFSCMMVRFQKAGFFLK